MPDDTLYSNPHEAALAVVATCMKKARLQIDVLVLNSILAGVLFSAGALLSVAIRVQNPESWAKNPGFVDFLGAGFFSIGLFYVILMGADLFNANVLFFTVGVLRRAVTVYDLMISWSISWLGNIAGTLLVSYVFIYLSHSGRSELWVKGSKQIVDEKAAFSFIETFLKAIAGNFYVCLAIYLQLMAKPLHVRLLVMTLPIFTFVALGFTHVVADMGTLYIGMLNGADLSVGKYIWKLLIPATLGNIVGGVAFGIIFPFYLHLVNVERDIKRLSLPEIERRDEQPELNMDSRIVRVPSVKMSEKDDAPYSNAYSRTPENDDNSTISSTYYGMASIDSEAERSMPNVRKAGGRSAPLSRAGSGTSGFSKFSMNANRVPVLRSPPGVFPIYGMGKPLAKEKAIENINYDPINDTDSENDHLNPTETPKERLQKVKTIEKNEENDYEEEGGYNVLKHRPGSVLRKAVTNMVERTLSKEHTESNGTDLESFPQEPENSQQQSSRTEPYHPSK